MGRKLHYDTINDLMHDLDSESIIESGVDPLEDEDLELLHLLNPDQPQPPKPPGKPPKKRGRKPKSQKRG